MPHITMLAATNSSPPASPNRRQALMLCVVQGLVLRSPIGLATVPDGNDRRIILSSSVSNLPRERNPSRADYYEVYAKALRILPVVLRIGVHAKPPVDGVPLSVDGHSWVDELDVLVDIDKRLVSGYSLELLPGCEMALSSEQAAWGSWVDSRRRPQDLRHGESLVAFFSVEGPRGTHLAPGTYRIRVRWKESAQQFFGMSAIAWQDVVFRVKEDEDSGVGRYTEDLIERHYLWGVCLYNFDRDSSRQEFQKAWQLVQEYLRRGAGDEPGLFNITPRYQAFAIAQRLDLNKKAIAKLSVLLSTNAEPADCKMRNYHFWRERGHLPRNIRDDLTLQLNRLYEQVYGKTMSGIPVDSVPVREYFPDSPKSESN